MPRTTTQKKNGSGRSKSAQKHGSSRAKTNGHSPKGNANGRKKTATRRKPSRAASEPDAMPAMILHKTMPKMTVRNGLQPDFEPEPEPERSRLGQRIDNMGASHVAAGIGGGAAATAAALAIVHQGWIGGKTAAGLVMGLGAATTAYGYQQDHDHLMVAGVGITTAGAVSLANQVAVDSYEAIEERAEKRKAKRDAEQAEKDKDKKLAEARALLDAEKKKHRNAGRIVITDHDGNPLEFAMREAAPGDHDEDIEDLDDH